jgi:predicted porin
MKRFFTVCMALLFAANAFAQEAKPEAKKGPEFKYSIWANAFAVTQDTSKKDEQLQYSQIRVRPMFTLTNENVSVVTRLEIDQIFGADYTSGANAATNADPDGDEIATKVKWAYINVKDMMMPGLSMTAGLAPYVYSVGFNNDMPMFNLIYDAGMVKVDLAYIKFQENKQNTTNAATVNGTVSGVDTEDDAQAYALKLPVKLGDISLTPSVLYYTAEKNHTNTSGVSQTREVTLTMPAFGVKAKMGAISLDADFQYITGESKNTATLVKTDVTAYAGYLNAGYKVSDSLKINLFGLYATGEDDKADTTTSFHSASMDEIEVGPMFIINDNGLINSFGVKGDEFDKVTEGLMMFGLAAEFKMDKLTALAQIAYAKTASDKGTNKDTALGTEIDLRLSYEVAPKTSLWVEGAYLAAGKYLETKNAASDKQNPMYYAAGLMTSF